MASSAKSIRRKRQGSFMKKPEGGWLHDGRGLAAGMGVFMNFPVTYVGTVELPQSMRVLSAQGQNEITHECIGQVVDAATKRKKTKRKLSKESKNFKLGAIDSIMLDVNLSVSATGIIIAPLYGDMSANDGFDPEAQGIINFHPMRLISLAAGGEETDYDYVCYISKDKETDVRYCHVFDCAELSDDTLATIGQAFVLAQQLMEKSAAARAKKAAEKKQAANNYQELPAEPLYDAADNVLNEAFAPPLYDFAESYLQVEPDSSANYAFADPTSALDDPAASQDLGYFYPQPAEQVDDVSNELLNLMKSQKTYASPAEFRKPDQPAFSQANFVNTLNKKTRAGFASSLGSVPEDSEATAAEPALKASDKPQNAARPTWVYYKPRSSIKKLDIGSLKMQQGKQ